jgi:hypothetical protein
MSNTADWYSEDWYKSWVEDTLSLFWIWLVSFVQSQGRCHGHESSGSKKLHMFSKPAIELMWRKNKDTIWQTHVAAMVRTAMIEPRRLSWRSVTDAMPTPRRRTMREALMLRLHS